MTQPIEATERNWNDVVGGDGLTLVDFWAPWCSWCRRLAPVLDRLAPEYEGRVRFAKVNVEEHPHVAHRYGVEGLPTMKFFLGGRPVHEIVGFLPEAALRRRIDDILRAIPVAA